MGRELLFSVTAKDFEVTHFSGTGNGGQNRNRKKKCVRIKHIETGVITTGQEERSLETNKKRAFKRMCEHPKFKTWLRIKTAEALGETIEAENNFDKIVEESMKAENLKIEYF